jgi:ligand-binding sensor domain-containing protein
VGTDMGPFMIQKSEVGESSVTFYQEKIPRNDGTNYADYLLDGIDITSIAIDGGNRKWFGSNTSGLYLISEDNMEQLQHFTKDNSLLFSDKIESLAIQHNTGEVFIGTDKGLCSFMSDATEVAEEMTKDNVYAYPNPVRPDYTGLITITGLTYNASIKIVSSNGTLIREGRSNGGTFTWDGCDLDGKKVASGVYMVQTATAEGKKGTVCKVAIVR